MKTFKTYILPLIILLIAAVLIDTVAQRIIDLDIYLKYDTLFKKLIFAGLFVYYFNVDNQFNKFRIAISISFTLFTCSELLIYYTELGSSWINLAICLTGTTTLIFYLFRFLSKPKKIVSEVAKLLAFGQYLVIIPLMYLTDLFFLEQYLWVSTLIPIITYAYTRVILNDSV